MAGQVPGLRTVCQEEVDRAFERPGQVVRADRAYECASGGVAQICRKFVESPAVIH